MRYLKIVRFIESKARAVVTRGGGNEELATGRKFQLSKMTELWGWHSSIVLCCTLESFCLVARTELMLSCSCHSTIKINKKSGTSEVKEEGGSREASL